MAGNFWIKLGKPFAVLAPMEDVTDTVFRQMVGRVAPPDVYVTEFTSCEGLMSAGREKVERRLKFSEDERPIVAQIWGTDPEKFSEAAKYIAGDFDGIDVNLGCPRKDILKQGAGAAMIGDKVRVAEILAAVAEAGLPVSVKTRLGMKKIMTEEWIGWLLEQNLAALTIHLRTAAETSVVPAHWEEMNKIMTVKSQTLVIGNGDVRNWQEGAKKCMESGCDGFMIGRGILTDPAAFDKSGRVLSKGERKKLLVEHLDLWERTWGEKKDFQIMKKFVKVYVNGFSGAAELRAKLMGVSTREEMVKLAV